MPVALACCAQARFTLFVQPFLVGGLLPCMGTACTLNLPGCSLGRPWFPTGGVHERAVCRGAEAAGVQRPGRVHPRGPGLPRDAQAVRASPGSPSLSLLVHPDRVCIPLSLSYNCPLLVCVYGGGGQLGGFRGSGFEARPTG